jgi:HAD superfamily hydrolase (TIGR01490 family)
MALNGKYNYIAFYDLDHTILKVNSATSLINAARLKGLISLKHYIQAVWLSLLFKLGSGHSSETINEMLSWLKGINEQRIIDLCVKIFQKKQIRKIRKDIIDSMDMHRNENAAVVLLSSATEPICIQVATYLNMDDIICSQLEVKDGRFTGKTIGPLVFGEEKRNQLLNYCKENGLDPGLSYYYGDSYSDRFVMEASGNPVAVNPDRKLKKLARENNWSFLLKNS